MAYQAQKNQNNWDLYKKNENSNPDKNVLPSIKKRGTEIAKTPSTQNSSNGSEISKSGLMQSTHENTQDLPQVTAKQFAIYDADTCQYLAGFRANESREIASLTKTMTCLVSLKLIKRFNLNPSTLYFSVSPGAGEIQGTSANLQENEWVLIEDLLYGLMLPSGNDAAMTLAENFGCLLYFNSIGQSQVFQEIHSVDVTEDIYVKDYFKLFVNEMNKYAKELDLRNTNFANPHGLAHNFNKSTCSDMAKLTYYALKNETFRKIVGTKRYKAQIKTVEQNDQITQCQIIWENTNKLLDKGFIGVKTGNTRPAGSCLSSWYQEYMSDIEKNLNIIIVLLGSKELDDRFTDTLTILEWWKKKLIQQANNTFR